MPSPPSSSPPSPSGTVHVIALGCAKNRVDAEILLGRLEEAGYRAVADPEEADLLVVETCGFIEAARQESVDTLLEAIAWKSEAPGHRKVLAAGCLVQRYPTSLAEELPEVDGFVGTTHLDHVVEVVRGDRPVAVTPEGASYLYSHLDRRTPSLGSHTAYVKIAEGCDRPCAFCAVPSIRGPQHSRDPGSVTEEVTALVAAGVREVNLVAQDLTAFGRDLGDAPSRPDLPSLLDALVAVPDLRWLRLLYAYPSEVPASLLAHLGRGPVLPYLDVPVQHLDDSVLRRMRRGYRGDDVWRLLDRLREATSPLWLRTTLLTGFPGETEGAFRTLLRFVERAEVDHLGVFAFSPEEGTAAVELADPVDPALANERAGILMEAQRGVSRRRLARLVGHPLTVLLEGEAEEGPYLRAGRHSGQAPEVDGHVLLADVDPSLPPGTFVRATVEQAGDHDLVARFDRVLDDETDDLI